MAVAPMMARPTKPVSVAETVAAHITTFPGVKVAHVQSLFGLPEENARQVLQSLVQARKIRLGEDELYYPA